jgi:muconolactone delta-isomerase
VDEGDARYVARARVILIESSAPWSARTLQRGSGKEVGSYRADRAPHLDRLLRELPMAAWMRVAVRPLEPHPNDPAAPG